MAQTEMASNLELFDWKLANNAKNLQKLYALHKRRPDSICLAMRLQSHGRLICLCRDGKSYMLNRETGIFELDLREREEDLREFESFMLSERNRDSEGFLHLNEKKYVGFSNYDSIAVDVVGTAQATRNVNPRTKEDSITFVETAPGLRKVLSTLLESFDVPAKGWKTILKKFNAIVNDNAISLGIATLKTLQPTGFLPMCLPWLCSALRLLQRCVYWVMIHSSTVIGVLPPSFQAW
jgi:hypothetical protein